MKRYGGGRVGDMVIMQMEFQKAGNIVWKGKSKMLEMVWGKGREIKRREKSTPQRLQFPFAAHFRNWEKRFGVEVFVAFFGRLWRRKG